MTNDVRIAMLGIMVEKIKEADLVNNPEKKDQLEIDLLSGYLETSDTPFVGRGQELIKEAFDIVEKA